MTKLIVVVLLLGTIAYVSFRKSNLFNKPEPSKVAPVVSHRADGAGRSGARARGGPKVVGEGLEAYSLPGMAQFEGIPWMRTTEGGWYVLGEMSSHGVVKGFRRPLAGRPFVVVTGVGLDGSPFFVTAAAKVERLDEGEPEQGFRKRSSKAEVASKDGEER